MQIIDTPTNLTKYVSFTGFAFYIAVRCGFDKHLYLTSSLNAHNHNTCIRLPQIGCTARKNGTLHYYSKSPNTTSQVLAGDAMAAKTKSHGHGPGHTLTWEIWTFCPQLPPASFSRARLARPIDCIKLLDLFLYFIIYYMENMCIVGDSYQSLSYLYRVSVPALSRLIPETCEAIYSLLKEQYLKVSIVNLFNHPMFKLAIYCIELNILAVLQNNKII